MMLASQLLQLEQAEIVRRSNDPDLAYLFKHAMTQETAYASLLKKARRDIHREVARAIETQYADHLEDFVALLAQHYAAAEDDAKTLEYAARAGDANARVFANAEAVAHYSIAIDSAKLLRVPMQELYLKRGRALELLGKYADALASYEEMESLAGDKKDSALELSSLVARATLFSTHTPLYDVNRALDFSDRALALARQIGDRLTEAKILWTQMLRHVYGSGDGQAGVDCGKASLNILRDLDPKPDAASHRATREQLAYTLNDLFYAYIQIGKLEEGLQTRLEARNLWRELDNKPMLADNLAGLALAQLTYNAGEQGAATAEEAYRVAESVTNPWSMAQGRTIKGYALVELGRFGEAIAAMRAGDEYATAVETGGAMLAARCGLASLFCTLGLIEPGLTAAQRAFEGAQKHIPDWHLWSHAVLIRLYLARGDLATAQGIADESKIESPDRKFFKAFMPGVAAVVLADADLALAKKNFARVLAVTDDALDYFLGSCPNYLPDLYLVRADAFLGQDKHDDAARAMQDALDATKNSRRVKWLVLSALTQFERAHGKAANAARWDTEARAEIEFIAQNMPEDLRAGFLDQANVKRILD